MNGVKKYKYEGDIFSFSYDKYDNKYIAVLPNGNIVPIAMC